MSLHLPPGKYFIGDPCYVFQSATWDKVLNQTGDFLDGQIQEVDGIKLWAHHTADGDGEYEDQNGVKYSVDSSLLGAVPIELIDDPAGEEDSGLVMDCPNGLLVEFDNGTFWIGPVCIKTNEDLDRDFDRDDLDGGYGAADLDRL